MHKVTLRQIGNSMGVTLPKTVLDRYHLERGTELHILETEDGFLLTPFNPEFQKWAEAYERTNKKYKNTLRALAKK